MCAQRLVFTGHIAGFGTAAGVRLVIGVWPTSPFGSFADVMVQTARDERILLSDPAEYAEVDAIRRKSTCQAVSAK